eukprot:CAMPEP_0175227220 /NCGR_PEP_ID=MMETSP0093-20121207/23294_1 /TAXON_ID=311494 /ORGANISM="Alexandrium monilatum, Strain CCMP3105" /LENGTH=41 /DNA_ID= /DNA_START= /DNA_END= /DNA_ORIENTATION=
MTVDAGKASPDEGTARAAMSEGGTSALCTTSQREAPSGMSA